MVERGGSGAAGAHRGAEPYVRSSIGSVLPKSVYAAVAAAGTLASFVALLAYFFGINSAGETWDAGMHLATLRVPAWGIVLAGTLATGSFAAERGYRRFRERYREYPHTTDESTLANAEIVLGEVGAALGLPRLWLPQPTLG